MLTTFKDRVRANAPALCVALAAVLFTPPAQAEGLWTKHKGNCDKAAFAKPAKADVDTLYRCARLWFAYRAQGKVSGRYGERAKKAFLRLYVEGSDEQAHLARQVLLGMRVSALPKRAARPEPERAARPEPRRAAQSASGGRNARAPQREKCEVPKPSQKDIKAARKHFSRGMKAYKSRKYDDALDDFLEMVKVAPGWPKSQYNTAAMYAMLDDEEAMIEHLQCLQDIGTDDSVKALRKARTDRDFARMRSRSPRFKALTGYARIKIGNSLGEYGEDNVDNLEGSLEALGYKGVMVTNADRPYTEPHIWYRPEARTAAYMVTKLIRHPRTKTHIIDWEDTDNYDVIIAWGDRIKKGSEPKLYVKDPDDNDKSLSDLKRKNDEALRKPDKVAGDVDHTLGAPQRGVNAANDSVNKTKNTMNKVQGTADKVLNPSLNF